MKTRLFYAILVAVGICLQGCTTSYAKDREDAKETPAGERLEISFRFQRGGIASSQYAIWIEDETGKLVRTLYVTSFTAKGGYEYRKDALPVWTSKAKPSNRALKPFPSGQAPMMPTMTGQLSCNQALRIIVYSLSSKE